MRLSRAEQVAGAGRRALGGLAALLGAAALAQAPASVPLLNGATLQPPKVPIPVQTVPAGPPAAPMPTGAECKGLPGLRLPMSFGSGETLDYDLDALGMNAGTMTMKVLGLRDGVVPVEIRAQSNTFFSKVRRVSGTATSYLDPRNLHPRRYLEDASENEVHRVADVRFTPANKVAHLVSTIDGVRAEADLPYASEGLDVAGTIYLMRQLPFKEGMPLCFDAYGIRRIWRVWGKVVGREHASLPVGEFEAWHLQAEAARLDWPEQRREIHVWITDDSRRLPLVAMGAIDLGTVRATLKAYARPDETRRAENKGNLKW